MKVHVIEADMSGNIMDAVQKRDDLGRAIAKLAAQVNEPVFFHDFKDPVAGAPIIMIECSDAFLSSVQKLPGFKNSHDVWPGLATERKGIIQQYFSQTPAAPAVKPKKPSHPKP